MKDKATYVTSNTQGIFGFARQLFGHFIKTGIHFICTYESEIVKRGASEVILVQ